MFSGRLNTIPVQYYSKKHIFATMKESILIIGSNGQIGTELANALRSKHGSDNVITSDIRPPEHSESHERFETIDVLDQPALKNLFIKYEPTQVYLLAALLSATGEQYPKKAWELNMNGL